MLRDRQSKMIINNMNRHVQVINNPIEKQQSFNTLDQLKILVIICYGIERNTFCLLNTIMLIH